MVNSPVRPLSVTRVVAGALRDVGILTEVTVYVFRLISPNHVEQNRLPNGLDSTDATIIFKNTTTLTFQFSEHVSMF